MSIQGKVTRLVREKGFGFVIDDDGQEYFFHRTAVAHPGFETLKEKDAVTFDEQSNSPKGPRAENVRKVK